MQVHHRRPTTPFGSGLNSNPLRQTASLSGLPLSPQSALSQRPGVALRAGLGALPRSSKALTTGGACAPSHWLYSGRRGGEASAGAQESGFSELDAELPRGGWPVRELIELLLPKPGCGELGLLTPLLRKLTRAGKTVALIAPPHTPFAEALDAQGIYVDHLLIIHPKRDEHGKIDTADLLWAAEQALKSAQFGAVVMWLPKHIKPEQLRRLHSAAHSSPGAVFACRPLTAQFENSPASLRVALGVGASIGTSMGMGMASNPHAPPLQPAAAFSINKLPVLISSIHYSALNSEAKQTHYSQSLGATNKKPSDVADRHLGLHILKRQGAAMLRPIRLQLQMLGVATATSLASAMHPPSLTQASQIHASPSHTLRGHAPLSHTPLFCTPPSHTPPSHAPLSHTSLTQASQTHTAPAQASLRPTSPSPAQASRAELVQQHQNATGQFMRGRFDDIMAALDAAAARELAVA